MGPRRKDPGRARGAKHQTSEPGDSRVSRAAGAKRTVAEPAVRSGYPAPGRKPGVAKTSPDASRRISRGVSTVRSAARQAFLDRSVDLLVAIADNAPDSVIARALREPTALATVAHALTESVVEERALDEADRQIAAALTAGARYKEDLLDRAGGAYTAEQLGTVLGISRQAVNDGRKTNLYFGVPSGASYAYPKLQVAEQGVLNGLREFLSAFALPDPWMKLAVLVEPSKRLGGRSPLEALRAGDVQTAVLVAETFGGHGA